jgi:hypothetical protein
LALAAVVTGSASSGRDDGRQTVVLALGDPGGEPYAWGLALAGVLGRTRSPFTLDVEPSSGDVANLRRLTIGTADLAMATMDETEPQEADGCVTEAANGATDERRVPLRALGRIFDDYLQVVVRADSPMSSIGDLAGRPVAVGVTGSGTALVACRVLSAGKVRVRAKPLDVDSGLAALATGAVDAVFWSGALPTDAITAAANRLPIRLLPLGGLVDTMRSRYGIAYQPATVPPGVYDGTDQVETLATPNLLVARADADPAMVTDVLTAIFAHRDTIAAAVPAANATDLRTAVLTGSLPLHPAAIAFYQRSKP